MEQEELRKRKWGQKAEAAYMQVNQGKERRTEWSMKQEGSKHSGIWN